MSPTEPKKATNATPSSAHLALALVTLRSKPADMPLDDYLTMLSNSMEQKPSISIQNGQFNTALFWKQAYQRSEAEKTQLQEYIHRLERARLEVVDLDSSSNPRKRKADTDAPVKANMHSRRRELNQTNLPVADNGNVYRAYQAGYCSPVAENIRALLRHVFHLRCLLRSHDPPVEQLCLCIGALCQSHEALLDSLNSAKGSSTTNSRGLKLSEILSAFQSSYPSILEAIDHATTKEASDNVLTIANASIVGLFQAILGQLHRLALDEVTRQEEERQSKGKKARSNTKAGMKDFQQIKASLEAQSETVSQMLDNMVMSLDPTKDAHCELLEGLLCALLDHAASSLSLMIFADPRAAKGQTGIEAPPGLLDVSHINTRAALTAAQVEAPYVRAIVKRALQFLRNNQGRMSPFMQEIFTWGDRKNLTDAAVLREKIESRLQGTLLRGVFGDDDSTFDNALRRELPLGKKDLEAIKTAANQAQDAADQDKSTWFIEQMWEELGWQILSSVNETS